MFLMNSLKVFYLMLIFLGALQGMGQTNNPNQELDSLLLVLRKTNNKVDKAKAHGRIGWLEITKNFETSKAHLDSSMALCQELGDTNLLNIIHYKLGVLNRFWGNYSEAKKHLNFYQHHVEAKKDSFGIADVYYQKGVVCSSEGNYKHCLQAYQKSLAIYETMGDSTSIGFTLNSIGIAYKNFGKYKAAETVYLEAVKLLEALHDKVNLADVYNSLGVLATIQKEYDKALDYFNKSLKFDEELNNTWGISLNHNNVGLIYLKKNECNKAIAFLSQAYEIQVQNNFKADLIETCINLGEAYRCKGDLAKSEFFLNQAINQPTKSLALLRDMHETGYKLMVDKQDYKTALYHHELYVTYKDSLFKEENTKSINALQIQYETQKKDQEIAQQNLRLEQQEVEILRKKNQYYIALGAGLTILLAGLGLWMYLRHRNLLKDQEIETLKKQKEVDKLEALIQGEEKERMRLAQDLHDGINGDLAVIKYKITAVDQEKFSKEERQEFKTAIEMLDNAIEQVRNISHNLAPPSLQNFDLIEAVNQYCAKVSETSNTKVDFLHYGDITAMSTEHETALYRMIQELLNNVIKHAQATETLVQINTHQDEMNITVEDNGQGYDTSDSFAGLGLKNIRSRVAFLKGELVVDSNNQGTTVTIHLDLLKLRND